MTSCHYSPQQFEEHLLAQGGVLGRHGVLGAGPAHRGVGPGLEVLATTNVLCIRGVNETSRKAKRKKERHYGKLKTVSLSDIWKLVCQVNNPQQVS